MPVIKFQIPDFVHLPHKNIDALLAERYRIFRHIFFDYLFLIFLVTFSIATFTRQTVVSQKILLNLPPGLFGIAPGVINTILFLLLIRIAHSSSWILKDLEKEKKTIQTNIAILALPICQLISNYLFIAVVSKKQVWLAQIWIGGAGWIGMMLVLFIIFRAFLRKYVDCLRPYSLILISNELAEMRNDFRPQKNFSHSQRINRIHLYLYSLVTYYQEIYKDSYTSFEKIFVSLDNLKTILQVDQTENAKKYLEEIISGLENTFSVNFVNKKYWVGDKEKKIEKKWFNLFYKLDGNFFFVHQIEKLFPYLMVLSSLSAIRIVEPKPDVILGKKNKASYIEKHLQRAGNYDLLIVNNFPITASLIVLLLAFHLWFFFLISSSQTFGTDAFLKNANLIFITLSVFYILYSGMVAIYQFFIRMIQIPYLANPNLYKAWNISFVFFFAISSLIFSIPMLFDVIREYVLPIQSKILFVLDTLWLGFFMVFARTPKQLLREYSDSLIIRRLIRVLYTIPKTQKMAFRFYVSRQLDRCKKLFKSLNERLSSITDNEYKGKSLKMYLDSINLYFDDVAISIRLGSKESRKIAEQNILIIIDSIATEDYGIIPEKVSPIKEYIQGKIKAPKRTVWERMAQFIGAEIVKIIIAIIGVYLIQQFAPELWEFLQKIATVRDLMG